MLLRGGHHVVWVGHYRLAWVVPRVVVGRGNRAGPRWKGISRGGGGARVVLDGHSDEVTVFACGYRGDTERLLAKHSGAHVSGGRGRGIVGGGRRLTVGVVERGREVNVGLGQVGRRQAEAVGHLGGRGQMHRLGAAAPGLGRSHVAVVNVGLQVPLGQVGAFAALHDAAHVEGASQALLDTLDGVCAAVHVKTERRKNKAPFRGTCRESRDTTVPS